MWDVCSILIFAQNTWEVDTYFWDVYENQDFQFYPDIRVKYLAGGAIFLGFSFYPGKKYGIKKNLLFNSLTEKQLRQWSDRMCRKRK